MLKNRSMPPATVIPVLEYANVRLAAEWLCGAFGFTERLRLGEHRAQLLCGDGAVVVAGGSGESPGAAHSVMVRVENVDQHCARATAAGAKIACPPSTYPYGERQYTAIDIGGHRWTFSETIADVEPLDWGGEIIAESE